MSVVEEVARVQYAGSGSTGPFAFNFQLFADDHIKVVKTVSGVDTTLVLTTDYSVSLATDFSSAEVTLVEALASGETLTLVRDPPLEQEIRWPRNDPFPAATHERAADLAVMLLQRLNEKLGRSLLLPESSTLSGLAIPSPQANLALGWNAAANNLTNIGIPTIYAQDDEPSGQIITNSLWIDTNSADIDVYQYNGAAWVDTGMDLKGPQGDQGDPGADGEGSGDVLGPEGGVVDNEFVYYDSTTGKLIKGSSLLIADAAAIRAATANRVIQAGLLSSALALVGLTDAASIAVNWTSFINASVTVTANREIANPSNVVAGQTRTIVIVGSSATERDITFAGNYVGVGTLTGITSSRRVLVSLFAETASRIWVSYRYQDDE